MIFSDLLREGIAETLLLALCGTLLPIIIYYTPVLGGTAVPNIALQSRVIIP
jgi:hypothetical protein